MPTYEYLCKECEDRFEVVQRMTDEPLRTCRSCGGPVRRVLFPTGVIFKGSGFHINDYASSSRSKAKEKDSAPASCPATGESKGASAAPA